ncbi:MAG: ATP-dependent DNA helicase RecQ, partial [Actinobacteria bacterium]|nr:ATP-dependent DNA helicase RecQ [Actinomycetota bacterium]
MADDEALAGGGRRHEARLRDEAELRKEAERCLRALAGEHARLREDQWTAIKALVADRRRALVVQRTGWGKSAVYFIATALLRARGAGPTVIVSPLLALMRNQVEAAGRAGIRARTINSANTEQWRALYAEVAAGHADVLLVSPERLNNPSFRDQVLPELSRSAGLVVVDEAHCISDWGHDFRPDYRRLRTLLDELPAGIPVLATTATANARVTRDVAEQLGTGTAAETLVLRGPLDRESLRLAVVPLPTAPQRLGWLAARLGELPGSGIVYTLTVAAAQEIAAFLREQGMPVAAYTGRDDPEDRLRAEEDLLANRVKALVATSALGMGFDKPDLGFIVHVGAPQSPVAYYQQIGRAGRAMSGEQGERAEVILLPGREDRDIWAYFASLAFPPERQVRAALAVLAEADRPLSTAALETRVDLSRSRLEVMLKVLDVDGAVRRVGGGWTSTGQPWHYDAERYQLLAAERARERQAMLDYETTDGCRMEYLRRQLDDPAAAPCGRCDNCTGRRAPAEVPQAGAAAARERLLRPGVEIEPRRMWPAGMKALGVDVAGKIPATVAAEPGRALGRLTDLGWGGRLRALLAEGAPDEPVPEQVVAAVIKVLAAWDWAQRPAGVLTLPSRSRPRLIISLGRQLAGIGRLPYLGALGYADDAGPGPRRHNSAQRLSSLWHAFEVPGDVRDAIRGLGGPVLVVDDRVETGWTMT